MFTCFTADTMLLRCKLGHAHPAACWYVSKLACCVDLQVFDITKEQEKTKQAEAAAQQAQHQAAAQQYAKASTGVHCKHGCFANVVVHAPLIRQQVVILGGSLQVSAGAAPACLQPGHQSSCCLAWHSGTSLTVPSLLKLPSLLCCRR